jgi:hypothetical protein
VGQSREAAGVPFESLECESPELESLELQSLEAPCNVTESMSLRAVLILLTFIVAGVRRATLMLMLAVVLSALDVERSGPPRRPSPVVVVLTDPPGAQRRSKPYRAHHRRAAVR